MSANAVWPYRYPCSFETYAKDPVEQTQVKNLPGTSERHYTVNEVFRSTPQIG